MSFNEAKKPIGMCCIAPVIAAKLLPGCEVTIGRDEDTARAIAQIVRINLLTCF
jgi:enhancing lycopene biosynthesis protein 2